MNNLSKRIRVRILGFICYVFLLGFLCMAWMQAFGKDAIRDDAAPEIREAMKAEERLQESTQESDEQEIDFGKILEMDVRVLIKTSWFEGSLHKEIEVTSDGDWYVERGKEVECREIYGPGETVRFTEEDPRFDEGSCVRIGSFRADGKIILKNIERRQGAPAYRGSVEINKLPDGMEVINCVGLEEYLAGVVPSEMPATYPVEALKAQAICARTYVVRQMLNVEWPYASACLDDSTAYQVYADAPEHENATRAVQDTEGMILLHSDGSLEDVHYFSTSCGRGTDASVWEDSLTEGIKLPSDDLEEPVFLRSEEPDDIEFEMPWYRWSYEVKDFDRRAFGERLQTLLGIEKHMEFGEVREIAITKRASGGAAKEMMIHTDAGTFYVCGEGRIRCLLCDGKTAAKRKDGNEVICEKLLPSAFFLLETRKDDGKVAGYLLTGGGYGHGVGMSQNGAKEMALRGKNAEEILRYYFDGCVLKKMEEVR